MTKPPMSRSDTDLSGLIVDPVPARQGLEVLYHMILSTQNTHGRYAIHDIRNE